MVVEHVHDGLVRKEESIMEYKQILKNARENLNGACRVCAVCNGKACSGEVPGMGGKGSGQSFTENVDSLNSYKLNMRVLHDAKKS